jgi:hypothetical protein
VRWARDHDQCRNVPGDGVVADERGPDPHRPDTSHTPVRTGSRCAQLRVRSGAHRRPAQPRPIQTLSARQARGRRARLAATLRTFVDGHEASDLQPAPPVGASPCSTVLPEMTRPPPAARVISTRRGWVCGDVGRVTCIGWGTDDGHPQHTATLSLPRRNSPPRPTSPPHRRRSRSSPAGINRCSAVYPARVCTRTCDGPLRLA